MLLGNFSKKRRIGCVPTAIWITKAAFLRLSGRGTTEATVLRDEAELQACLDVLSARPLCLVGVQAPLATLEQREQCRDDRATGMARQQFGHPAFVRGYDLVVDTSTGSAAELAAEIRRLLG